jgi:hypothetical protein
MPYSDGLKPPRRTPAIDHVKEVRLLVFAVLMSASLVAPGFCAPAGSAH